MAEKILTVRQGNSDTFTDVVSGLTSLSGYTAKMYVYNIAGTLLLTLTGSISTLTITYQLTKVASKALAVASHYYESIVFDSNNHVYTSTWGPLVITTAKNNNPS